jgi:hypothetical protein
LVVGLFGLFVAGFAFGFSSFVALDFFVAGSTHGRAFFFSVSSCSPRDHLTFALDKFKSEATWHEVRIYMKNNELLRFLD